MVKTYNGLPVFAVDIDNEMQGVEIISIVDKGAILEDFIKFSSQETEIKMSVDEEKRIVTGPALIVDKPIYRVNDKGEGFYITFSKDAIERIAMKFFADRNNTNLNLQHEYGVENCFYYESYLVNKDRGIAPVEWDLPDGSWMVSCKVNDDDTWQLIKDGTLKGFSIEGMLSIKPLEEPEKEKVIDTIEDLIKYLSNK